MFPFPRRRKPGIPIFIISFNRLTVLRRAVRSFRRLVPWTDLVILDNASDYPPLLEWYRWFERRGGTVLPGPPIGDDPDGLSEAAERIEAFKRTRPCEYYAVTDSDVSLETARRDVLDIYATLLDRHPDQTVAGPMLRIRDIPSFYPAREWAFFHHKRQFWSEPPRHFLQWKNRRIWYQISGIDTTFALMRGDHVFRRAQPGIRVYHPCEALHLDWYLDPKNLADDQRLYLERASEKVAHWCAEWFNRPPEERLGPGERWICDVAFRDGDYRPVNIPLPGETDSPRGVR